MDGARRGIAAAAILLMLTAGCKKSEAPPGRHAAGTASAGLVTPLPPAPGMPWKIALDLDAPPRIVKATTFRVKLADLSGQPVDGAQVEVSLVMKLMDMDKNQVTLAGKGGGEYEGSATFSMTGPWEVVVTASAGGKSGEQKFEVAVRD